MRQPIILITWPGYTYGLRTEYIIIDGDVLHTQLTLEFRIEDHHIAVLVIFSAK